MRRIVEICKEMSMSRGLSIDQLQVWSCISANRWSAHLDRF